MMMMMKPGNQSEGVRDSALVSSNSAMDLKASRLMQCASSVYQSIGEESPLEGDSSFYCTSKEKPLVDAFPDPLCKLNLKETSDFVKAFPVSTNNNKESSAVRRREVVSFVAQRRLDAPSTPGRPIFSFSPWNPPRRSIPSKWDDAQKWLISSSCHESPAHGIKPSDSLVISKQNDGFHQKGGAFAELLSSNKETVPVFLKDKFTDNVEQVLTNFQPLEPMKEGFVFKSSFFEPMKDAAEVQHRDIGTEMTPLGSSTTSRCHTPIKSTSPLRHNTPASRSGPLFASNNTTIDISELNDCHFAKLELCSQFDAMISNWSSREEEEQEISKSLRHFDISDGRKSVAECRASLWEDKEKTKSCTRYQREEAKIQAWVDLQNAKAEEQSRKLEVKIQKMRSNLEEKLMKRMAIVHRRAKEWRAAAQLQHSQQLLRAYEQAQKIKSQQKQQQQQASLFTDRTSCGCFSCSTNI
ncbi:Remorin C-terminal protein [Dioscorea alata]|uniref:Remorin C-terminal protein n=1 Tax=Dioscorea alata TaxID=55571 RepID=A0ACB7U7Z6_DIOAL|nr:Remorin C-terminal protein [Dioscorea alata]